MNLSEAKLLQRSKELDARESFIDTKAKILEDAPITLKVYDARVKASEDRLKKLTDQIKQAEESLSSGQSDTIDTINRLKDNKEALEVQISELNHTIKGLKSHISELKEETRAIKSQIADREDYLEQQEAIINQSIDDGNERLLDLKDEEENRLMIIKELKSNYATLRSDYDLIVVEFDTTTNNYQSVIEDLKTQKLKLEAEVKGLNKKIQEESTKHKVIVADVDKKLAILKEKEEGITSKRDALRLEKQEVEEDKRRWNSTKALYDL